jgi:hypothetical protein
MLLTIFLTARCMSLGRSAFWKEGIVLFCQVVFTKTHLFCRGMKLYSLLKIRYFSCTVFEESSLTVDPCCMPENDTIALQLYLVPCPYIGHS